VRKLVGEAIGFFYTQSPNFLSVAALLIALFLRGRGGAAERLLAWTLLLPNGVTGLSTTGIDRRPAD
jgi:hypothetical protein